MNTNPPPNPPPPIPPRKQTSPFLIGCLSIVGFFIIVTLLGLYWLFRRGDQIDTGIVVGADTVGWVRFSPLPGDEGVAALIDRFFIAADEASQKQRMKDFSPKAQRAFEQVRSFSRGSGFSAFLPKEATAALGKGRSEEGEASLVAAINMGGYSGLIRVFVRLLAEGGTRRRHGSHEVIEVEDGAAVALVGSTVLVARRGGDIAGTLDRIDRGETAMAPRADLEAMRAAFAERYDIHAVTARDAGTFASWVAGDRWDSKIPELWQNVRVFGAGADVVSEDVVKGEAIVDCADAATASRLAEHLTNHRERVGERFRDLGMTLTFETSAEASKLTTRYEITGIGGAIDRAAENFQGEQ